MNPTGNRMTVSVGIIPATTYEISVAITSGKRISFSVKILSVCKSQL